MQDVKSELRAVAHDTEHMLGQQDCYIFCAIIIAAFILATIVFSCFVMLYSDNLSLSS